MSTASRTWYLLNRLRIPEIALWTSETHEHVGHVDFVANRAASCVTASCKSSCTASEVGAWLSAFSLRL